MSEIYTYACKYAHSFQQLLNITFTCFQSCDFRYGFLQKQEGPEGVKWELGLAGCCPGKMGFKPLGLGFGHWEWE